jgi:hypothetical protein
MLPLHRTFKSLAFAYTSLLVLVSCSNHSKNDIEIIKALNETIESSNKMLSMFTSDVIYALKDKIHDPASKERAQVWYPKAEKIQQLSKELFDYIENLKSKIKGTSVNSNELFERLKNYQKQVLEIDPKITGQFQRSMKVFTQSTDSLKKDQQNLFQDYFRNVSFESAIAMLSKLQNNIKQNELGMVGFCNEQCAYVTYGPDFFFSALVIANSSVVLPNDKLEITAGIGSFTVNASAEFFIYGKQVKIQEDGAAHYKIKAPLKPGKYYVPVKINFTDQNGKQQSIQKEIEYTVANIQKE